MSTSVTGHVPSSAVESPVALSTWLCFTGLLVGQFVAVLDIQIVSSSLAAIQSSVGASSEEISWVQTSYLIGETLGIPLVGFLTQTFGLRRMFVTVCSMFMLTSLIVGMAYDLSFLIVARALQGFVGGLMLPLAFTFGFSAFPKSVIPRVSLIISIIGVLAPTVGPVIGGYITDWLDWRWLFFINLPIGGIAVVIVATSVDRDSGKQFPPSSLDWKSLILLSVALFAAQFVLEEGQRQDWLDSDLIVALLAVSSTCGLLFAYRSLTIANPLIDLRVFARHDYRAGWLLITVGGLSLFGGSYLLPLFLAEVRDYSPLQTGETLILSGAVMVLSGLLIMPRLKTLDLRIPIACGFAVTGYGYWLGHEATANWDFWELAALQTWRGLGVIIAITGTQTLTMGRVPPNLMASATSLLYLARNLGGAAGVAVLSTVLAGQTRQNYVDLAAGASVRVPHLSVPGTGAELSGQIDAAARVLAFNFCFALIALACWGAALIALTFGTKR